MKILFDMDEVIVQFLNGLLKEYNKLYNSNVTIDSIVDWDISDEFTKIYTKPHFFENLLPYPKAIETINELIINKHEIYIVTDAGGNLNIINGKYNWLKKYMPFINLQKNVILAHRKNLINGDIIIEDNPYTLSTFPNITIAMDKPYNKNVNSSYRVYENDFTAIKSIIDEIEGRVY